MNLRVSPASFLPGFQHPPCWFSSSVPFLDPPAHPIDAMSHGDSAAAPSGQHLCFCLSVSGEPSTQLRSPFGFRNAQIWAFPFPFLISFWSLEPRKVLFLVLSSLPQTSNVPVTPQLCGQTVATTVVSCSKQQFFQIRLEILTSVPQSSCPFSSRRDPLDCPSVPPSLLQSLRI